MSETRETATVSLRMPSEMKERLHRAAYWDRETATEIMLQGVMAELNRRTKANGGPFPPVPEKPRKKKP